MARSQRSLTELDNEGNSNQYRSEDERSYTSLIKELLQNSEYLLLMLSIVGFFFCVAGIQYWSVDYMQTVYGVDKSRATMYFAFTAFFSPILGMIFGGSIISYHGGYHTKRSREIVLIIGWICIAITIPIPIVNSIYYFIPLVFALLFFGSSLTPSLTGLMLSTVPEYQRAAANSVAQFFYNLMGWMPAPFIYGLVSQIVDN